MKAIVFTTNTGHTEDYAKILSRNTSLPVYSLNEAVNKLSKNTQIIYLGWLFANNIKGLRKARKFFKVSCVCAVGLCDTGTAIDAVKKTNSLSDDFPLFTIQGGMDKTKLHGLNKFMINMLIKSVSSKKNKTQDDERMLYLLENDENYVCEENISDFLDWYYKSK